MSTGNIVGCRQLKVLLYFKGLLAEKNDLFLCCAQVSIWVVFHCLFKKYRIFNTSTFIALSRKILNINSST